MARLTGTWAVDHSIASGTGLLDLRALDWDREALAIAGIDAGRLSPLVPATHRLELGAAAAAELGSRPGSPLVVGAGDGPLANLGVGAVHPGVAACSIGTSGALRLMVERPAVDPQRRRLLLRADARALDRRRRDQQRRRRAALGRRGAGARPRPPRRGASCSSWPAEVPAGSDGLLMLPYLLSERAPHWSSVPRGAYVGLTRHHGRGHLVRAALEGVCLQLALVLASMRDAGNEVREIRATGGFARSDLWRQMLADALGMPIGFPAGHEGSAFGAALLAMDGARAGRRHRPSPRELVEIEDVVEPEAGAAGVYARPAAHLRRRSTTRWRRPFAPWSATAERCARRPRRALPLRGACLRRGRDGRLPAGAEPA